MRAKRVGGVAARGDGDRVAGIHEALHQQLAEIAGAADHQYILVHGISLLFRVYFLLWMENQQTRKNAAMTKKFLCMEAE